MLTHPTLDKLNELGLHGMARVLGPITPLGGLMFIAGWGTVLAGALRRN